MDRASFIQKYNEERGMRGAMPIAVAAAALTECIALLLIPTGYITVDDTVVEAVLSGAMSGEPSPYISFVNYVLCAVVSGLYRAIPQIHWWPAMHVGILCCSFMVMSWAVIAAVRTWRPQATWWQELFAALVVCVGIFACAASYMQFTVTAVIPFVAAMLVSGCFALPVVRDAGRNLCVRVVVVVGVVLGFAMRWQSGALGFAFWAVVVLCMCLAQRGSVRERIRKSARPLVLFGVAAALSASLFVVHKIAWSTSELSECHETLVAYAAFTDKPQVPYEEGKEFYNSLGWDEDLFYLSRFRWFTMDERINPETLKPFLDVDHDVVGRFLSDPLGCLEINLNSMKYPYMFSVFTTFAVIAVAACAAGRTLTNRLAVMAPVLMAFVLMGKLVLDGRTPERAMLAILLPALGAVAAIAMVNASCKHGRDARRGQAVLIALVVLVMMPMAFLGHLAGGFGKLIVLSGCACIALVLTASYWSHRRPAGPRGAFRYAVLACATCVVMLPTIGAIRDFGWTTETHQIELARQENADAYFDYAVEHPDTIFFAEPDLPFALPSPFDFRWAQNCTIWGGWRTYYPWYEEAMQRLGLPGTPTTDVLLQDNVRLVLGSDRIEQIVDHYLTDLYGEVELQVETVLTGDIRIYKVIRTEAE